MAKDTMYDLLFILIGLVNLYLALNWKKPAYGGGIVRKYFSMTIGILFIIYGLFSLF
jgi:hypothetical protein